MKDIISLYEEKGISAVQKGLKRKKIEINDVNDLGYNYLMTSLQREYIDLAFFLVQNGVNLLHVDSKGRSILHFVEIYDYEQLVYEIIEKEQKLLNIIDFYGNQPLWTAVMADAGFGNKVNIIKRFLSLGAQTNHKNKVGRSPISISKDLGYKEVLECFN
ncbi:MAG: hypothetical protein HRT68_07515 [Flavobacteriaceae bacterium]|nr:hypothetical protein [Flavobacteriaceae bacterium]